jgi:glyoxylate/succinic semialdehyde reductase
MTAGTSYIDHSTIDEATGVKIFDAIKGKGARFLSAPVSGGWRDAVRGL